MGLRVRRLLMGRLPISVWRVTRPANSLSCSASDGSSRAADDVQWLQSICIKTFAALTKSYVTTFSKQHRNS